MYDFAAATFSMAFRTSLDSPRRVASNSDNSSRDFFIRSKVDLASSWIALAASEENPENPLTFLQS